MINESVIIEHESFPQIVEKLLLQVVDVANGFVIPLRLIFCLIFILFILVISTDLLNSLNYYTSSCLKEKQKFLREHYMMN